MAKKSKKSIVILVSKGTNEKGRPTGTRYYIRRSKGKKEKLILSKFDPYAFHPERQQRGCHVMFHEEKK